MKRILLAVALLIAVAFGALAWTFTAADLDVPEAPALAPPPAMTTQGVELTAILAGKMFSSAGFAFRGLIIAEAIAATTGIGYLIFDGAANQHTDRTIVGMIVMGALWLAIDLVYLRPFERATVQKWGMVVTAEQREAE